MPSFREAKSGVVPLLTLQGALAGHAGTAGRQHGHIPRPSMFYPLSARHGHLHAKGPDPPRYLSTEVSLKHCGAYSQLKARAGYKNPMTK